MKVLIILLTISYVYANQVHVHQVGDNFKLESSKKRKYTYHKKTSESLIAKEKAFQKLLFQKAGIENKFSKFNYMQLEKILDYLEANEPGKISLKFPTITSEDEKKLFHAFYQ